MHLYVPSMSSLLKRTLDYHISFKMNAEWNVKHRKEIHCDYGIHSQRSFPIPENWEWMLRFPGAREWCRVCCYV